MSGSKRTHVDPLPRVVEFLDSMLQVDASAIPETIPLAGPVWNSAAEHRFLIVRGCYADLFSFCESALAVEEGDNPHLHRDAVVTGTAGTGKTYFGLYAALQWFAAGKIVWLWFGSQSYIFAKELHKEDPLTNAMKKFTLSNDDEVWYHYSIEVGQLEKLIATRTVQRDLPVVHTIRDSGGGQVVKKVQSGGPVLYTISSGHETLLKAIISKSSYPADAVRRFAALWTHGEFLNGTIVATCKAYIKSRQKYVIDPQNESFNKESYRYRLYLDEGYRRYGGSARLVLKFIRYAGVRLASQAFDSIENSLQVVRELPDEQDLSDAIDAITEKKSVQGEAYVKAKALVYHRVPDSDMIEATIVIATDYIRRKLFTGHVTKSKEELGKLITALQSTGTHQSPYGDLYESDAHGKLLNISELLTLQYLGCHKPNGDDSILQPRQAVSLNLNSLATQIVLGRSLQNCDALGDDPTRKYILPFCTNFPSHDSFVISKASLFYEAKPNLSKDKLDKANVLLDYHVLVGFQMTVSGSGKFQDKPSHTLRGVHFTDHVDGLQEKVVNLLRDVITVFISPTETSRKANVMPVLRKEGSRALQGSVQRVGEGAVPQYVATVEHAYLEDLINGN